MPRHGSQRAGELEVMSKRLSKQSNRRPLCAEDTCLRSHVVLDVYDAAARIIPTARSERYTREARRLVGHGKGAATSKYIHTLDTGLIMEADTIAG